MADMVLALLLAGLLVGFTKSGRKSAGVFYKAAGGPSRKQLVARRNRLAVAVSAAAGRMVRRAGRSVASAGASVGHRAADRAESRWNARAAPDPPVARATPAAIAEPAPAPEPQLKPEPEPEPQSTTEESTVNTEIESPSSDGELLSILEAVAQAIRGHAGSMEEFEGMLAGLQLDRSVVGAVDAAAGHLADAADQLAKAGQLFESVYEDVRETARKGMHFRGEDAA